MSTVKIDVFCPQCKAKLAVPTSALGKQGKCPRCQSVFPLAMPAQRTATAAASPLTPLSPSPYAAPALEANVLDPIGGPDLIALDGGGLSPLPAGNQFAPAMNSNPFAAPAPPDEYSLQPAAPSPYAPTMTLPSNASMAREQLAAASASMEEARQRKYDNSEGGGWGINAGIGGGALLMLGAVVWFVVGLACGYIFFYPPIMFIIGLIAFFKGIFDNFSE